MPADLVTLDRAKRAFPNLLDNSLDLVIGGYITAASRATEKYCKRIFSVQTYDEVYDTDGTGSLILRKFPVISVSRLASTLTTVLTITQTNQSVNSRATVGTQQPSQFDIPTPTIGLTLTRVASGVTSIDQSILWTTCPTLGTVAAAVNALGNGWQAVVAGGYTGWASNDITPLLGAQGCLGGGASLMAHVADVSNWQIDPEPGEIRFGYGMGGTGDPFGLGWVPGGGFGSGFEPGTTLPRGGRNMRVIYQAGFTVIPEDLQQGVALWTAHMFQNSRSAGDFVSEALGDRSVAREINTGPPKHVKTLIDQYKDYRA